VIYAFARAVDDAVDEVGLDGNDTEGARRLLAAWRRLLTGGEVGAGPEARLAADLQATLAEFPVDRRHLLDLIAGVERDLAHTRYETYGELQAYCHGVASTVGLACLPIFDLDEERHREFAVILGLAVQMVNILRDVATDALRGRIYLPLEDLRKFGYTEDELLGLVYNEKFWDLMSFEAARAQNLFAAALAALPQESRRAARPALVMGRLYRRLLKKLERADFRVFGDRPRLNFAEKILSLIA